MSPGGISDTNVLVVANGKGDHDPECINRCVDNLDDYKTGKRTLFLDSLGHILDEYSRQIQYNLVCPHS